MSKPCIYCKHTINDNEAQYCEHCGTVQWKYAWAFMKWFQCVMRLMNLLAIGILLLLSAGYGSALSAYDNKSSLLSFGIICTAIFIFILMLVINIINYKYVFPNFNLKPQNTNKQSESDNKDDA